MPDQVGNPEDRFSQIAAKIKYYIFEAILIVFLVIFEDDKNDNFFRGDKSFQMLKRTKSRQNRIMSKHLLRPLRTSKKVKRGIL